MYVLLKGGIILELPELDHFLNKAVEERVFPGCVVGIVSPEGMIYQGAYGFQSYEEKSLAMTEETIFDLASLTKVTATTTSILHLIDRGVINLFDYLKEFFPEIPEDKKDLTVYHLLTHSSGLQAVVRLWDQGLDQQDIIEYILNLKLKAAPGEQMEYSDPNFILLGELVRLVSGLDLDSYAENNIYKPLAMSRTAFNPLNKISGITAADFAPTERCKLRARIITAEVHDENSYFMSGVSGHAGLFSTVLDLGLLVQMILNNGRIQDKQIFSRQIIQVMRRNWTSQLKESRGLGWDLRDNYRSSAGILMSSKSFGHTGFTGTSIWIDPELEIGFILLSNRVYPSRDNKKIISLRPRFHNLLIRLLDKNGII